MGVKAIEQGGGEGLPSLLLRGQLPLQAGTPRNAPRACTSQATSRRPPHNRDHRRPPLSETRQAVVKTAPAAGPQPSWRPPEPLDDAPHLWRCPKALQHFAPAALRLRSWIAPGRHSPNNSSLKSQPQNRISSTAFPPPSASEQPFQFDECEALRTLCFLRAPWVSPHAYGDRQGAFGASKGCP